MELIEELPHVPQQYFRKLVNTEDIWEIRVKVGRDIFRLLGFFDGPKLVILDHAFSKKTQKTPKAEIDLAERR